MKYLNIISDKIDYLFRRGKNADERCYDFFIRTVTFLLITLIVLCYGSFVHADGSFPVALGIDLSKLSNGEWLFNDTDAENYLFEYYGNNAVNIQLIPNYIHADLHNLPFDSSIDTSNNYLILYDCNSNYAWWSVVLAVPKDLVANGHIIFAMSESCTYISDGTYDLTLYSFDSNNNLTSTSTLTVNEGLGSYNMGSNYWQKRTVCSNMPLYCGDFSVNGFNTLKNNNFEDSLSNLYNMNYYTIPNVDLCSGAYISNGVGEVIPEPTESNANHNYLNDIQIGLTSQNLGQNILSSQVIIGCDVDDWILNNLDDYSMYINYKLYIKDSYQSSPNDPEFNYSVILPLRTFYNRAYTYSVAELFRNCTDSNNQSFQSYFNIVGEGQKVLSDQPYNAIIPCFLETIYQGLGKYYVTPDPQYQTIPYTIFQFKLDVSCSLSYQGMSVNDASGIYLKEFDFKNGSESVKVADILRNENPWEGESEPQQSPIVPSANNPISGGSGSSSVNVNVDVSGQKIPIGVKTKQEIQIILDNYKEVNDTFMDDWQDLSEPMNNNNFMHFLSDTTRTLPAVDYLIKGACAVFGLSILLFVLKVLLF